MKYELIFKDKSVKNIVSKSEDKIKNYITENFDNISSMKKIRELNDIENFYKGNLGELLGSYEIMYRDSENIKDEDIKEKVQTSIIEDIEYLKKDIRTIIDQHENNLSDIGYKYDSYFPRISFYETED